MANISKETIHLFQLTVEEIIAIKEGSDLTKRSGEVVLDTELVMPKKEPRSYAYCSDTCYDERVVELVKGVNLLYHEATFLQEMDARAKETFHTTAMQAGMVAKKANVKQLMIGHYSARYKDLQPLLDEAKSVFENTILAIEGESVVIN